jgi:hypothetical protein
LLVLDSDHSLYDPEREEYIFNAHVIRSTPSLLPHEAPRTCHQLTVSITMNNENLCGGYDLHMSFHSTRQPKPTLTRVRLTHPCVCFLCVYNHLLVPFVPPNDWYCCRTSTHWVNRTDLCLATVQSPRITKADWVRWGWDMRV